MKNTSATFILVAFTFFITNAQIKIPNVKPKINNLQVNPGIKIKDIKKLSVNELAAKNIPIISIAEKQGNGKPLKSWKITPNNPVDNWLSVNSFYGWLEANKWGIQSYPFFEGTTISSWSPGWLELKFRQSKGIEYRMKIKMTGTNFRSKVLYVQMNEMSGRYPVNPDGIVNVVWTSELSSRTTRINIGHLLPTDFASRDYPHGFPKTLIDYVSIVRD